jgi:hypothetical protein
MESPERGTDAEVQVVARAIYNTMYAPQEALTDEAWNQVWASDQFTGSRFRLEAQARAAITALDTVRRTVKRPLPHFKEPFAPNFERAGDLPWGATWTDSSTGQKWVNGAHGWEAEC